MAGFVTYQYSRKNASFQPSQTTGKKSGEMTKGGRKKQNMK